MKKYKLIIQDTFNKLELGKVYNIKDYILYNDDETIKMYRLSKYQLETMFEEVIEDEKE